MSIYQEREVLEIPDNAQANAAWRLEFECHKSFDSAHRERARIEADKTSLAEIERIGKESRER